MMMQKSKRKPLCVRLGRSGLLVARHGRQLLAGIARRSRHLVGLGDHQLDVVHCGECRNDTETDEAENQAKIRPWLHELNENLT